MHRIGGDGYTMPGFRGVRVFRNCNQKMVRSLLPGVQVDVDHGCKPTLRIGVKYDARIAHRESRRKCDTGVGPKSDVTHCLQRIAGRLVKDAEIPIDELDE